MVKIKPLSRSTTTYLPPGSSAPLPRNLDPSQHPFSKAREYTRALNATKLTRMFAQPFLGQLGNGHIDGVYALCKDPTSLTRLASGSGDGEVKIWNLVDRKEIATYKAHLGMVTGLTFTATSADYSAIDQRLLSCGVDKTVKLWDPNSTNSSTTPMAMYLGAESFNSISHHRTTPTFATASSTISIWDISRENPISNLTFGTDTLSCVRFNQIETSILASSGHDRSLIFYDLRTNSPLHKLYTTLRTNSICWNPMEAFNFAAASEDHNVYIFDMRKLDRALNVLKGHVAAVMDVDYSPTGEELVTASYDRTIRVFRAREGHSRDAYHTKRMQRVFSAKFSPDTKYLLSASDDGNIRLWRSQASDRSRILSAREREKREYDDALRERYKHMPEIKRIDRHRHVPKVVKKAAEIKKEEISAIKRREENVRKHSKKGEMRRVPEREKMVLGREQ
ncbi:U3 small nucleolar RNA associated protein [Tirmania nivea]|nr:U3 small nucleolar RNA associated protein [Tirmania nivea]